MELTNRTIVITGATSGIGLALTLKLTGQGNRVVAVGRSVEKLEELESSTKNVMPVRCNLDAKGDVIALAQHINALAEPVSVLVNNAAVQFTPKFIDADFSFDGIETEITTNFTAVAWLTSLMLPALLECRSGSAIVFLSSGLAIYPKTSSAIYSATKAAIHSLSQSLRYQLEGTSVRVMEILLPLVDTGMTEGRGDGKISPDRAAEEIIISIQKERDEHFVGKAGLLPLISRISPSITKRILKSS